MAILGQLMSSPMIEEKMVESSQENWQQVCGIDDLQTTAGVCALVKGLQIAIFHFADLGETYALQNYDPFSKANVLSRGLTGDLNGQLVVASPIYKQHFNLITGQCLEDDIVQLKTFPLRIVDNQIEISIPKIQSVNASIPSEL